ncbi:class I SAM-dependent methyltransferase [Candidatus Daviesbacteria bacterium]|nr:class I SAM-dependent methyltransferase [Candidatus Daviesbacteria bacterium]
MCPVCKSDTKIFAKFKNHLVYKCKKCGFGYTTNLSAHLGQYHRDEVYIQEEKLFENIFQKRVNKVMNFKKKGEVLDVGSSTGLMLKLFKDKGFNVLGVEISNKAAALSKNRGIDVITIPFEEIQFKKKFDVILFNHTLEHLKDPFLAINKASRLLNKDGLLYIDLPNFGSLSASLKRKNWPYLLLEEHLWHFSLQSLEILLRKNGLKIIFTERASGIWDLNNPFLELFTSLYKFKKRFIINLLTAIPGLILSKLNMGSDLLVIAKKND